MNKEFENKMLERAEAMRINPTHHEKIFKERLIKRNIKFKCQVVVGCYIVDFLIGNVIVEIDGESHRTAQAREYDFIRDSFLHGSGYSIVRIQNKDVRSFSINKIQDVRKKNKKNISIKPTIDLRTIKSTSDQFKKLSWDQQRVILQRERLYG